ncbi:hypothetical protein E2C01_067580 [Portunus trituberculatus]|uniref:Uncharacterized protein n=1 Tax=Portunus trituberculatus TaxID=210409 RepID=A0A5B7HVF5_PORTR|nr:hypothetical protein [Portunus trituberculatus]
MCTLAERDTRGDFRIKNEVRGMHLCRLAVEAYIALGTQGGTAMVEDEWVSQLVSESGQWTFKSGDE